MYWLYVDGVIHETQGESLNVDDIPRVYARWITANQLHGVK